jgi:hypothetical protein
MNHRDEIETSEQQRTSAEDTDLSNRREVVSKLGRYAAYAAPFAALALTKKAQAASGGGPRKTPRHPH